MYDVLLYIVYLLLVLVFVKALSGWRSHDLLFKLITVHLGTMMVIELTGKIFNRVHINNTPAFNIYLFCDLWLMGIVITQLISAPSYRQLFFIGLGLCTMVDILCVWRMGFGTFANWGFLCECILFTIAFLVILIRLFTSDDTATILKEPRFWLSMGCLVYYGGNIPLFSLLNYVIKYHPDIAEATFSINSILLMLRYAFVWVALLCQQKQRRLNITHA